MRSKAVLVPVTEKKGDHSRGPVRMKYRIRASIGTCHISSEPRRNFLLTWSQKQKFSQGPSRFFSILNKRSGEALKPRLWDSVEQFTSSKAEFENKKNVANYYGICSFNGTKDHLFQHVFISLCF